ncbi:hypothetical protein [Halorientalis halophila]|uniref:hypothetical protein n=1 Tax=Halorientalis halophila TaxID=3108499 RepID=UPI00300831EB
MVGIAPIALAALAALYIAYQVFRSIGPWNAVLALGVGLIIAVLIGGAWSILLPPLFGLMSGVGIWVIVIGVISAVLLRILW